MKKGSMSLQQIMLQLGSIKKEKIMSLEITEVKLFKVNGHKTIKANGDFTVNNALKVKFTLMNGPKGLFVGLPGEYYQPKDGSEKKWASKVEVTSEEFVKTLSKAVIDAYNKGTNKSASVDQGKSTIGTQDQANIPF
jgi:DNA-binding cell septation regulator SpoVG